MLVEVLIQTTVQCLMCRFAQAKRDGSEYFVLLIITDGIITDMLQTTEAIVKVRPLALKSWLFHSCLLPLSLNVHSTLLSVVCCGLVVSSSRLP